MRMPLFIWMFLLLISSCQEDVQLPFQVDNLELQVFTIKADQAHTLTGKNGVTISIPVNTFTTTKDDGTVKIQLREAISKSDMVRAGLNTVTADGSILESYGMYYLNVEPPQAASKEIQVQIPADFIQQEAQLFDLQDNGWKLERDISNTLAKELAAGKAAFEQYCVVCHSRDLREVFIGSALGNVHLFRERDWLVNFTKNSQQMIADGDSLAVCLWEEWKPVVMNDFTELDDETIHRIYDWIENESQVQQIDTNEVEYVLSCEETVIGDPDDPNSPPIRYQKVFVTNQNVDSVVTISNYYSTNNSNGHSSLITLESDANMFYQVIYQPNLDGLNWKNVDYFLRNDTIASVAVSPFQVEVLTERSDLDWVEVQVIFNKRNILFGLAPLEEKSSIFSNASYAKNGKIVMPKEEVTLLAYRVIGNKVWLGKKEVMVNEQNNFSIQLREGSQQELQEIIDAL